MALVNRTVITLIQKVKDPVRMKQLRPINLFTMVYKFVSKVLVNLMKPFLSACIDDTQAAFLKGMLISDNILIAHELIHYLNSSKNGQNKGVAIKLDMEKAFDRGLLASLHVEQRVGRIGGIRASQQGPPINHLFYADDNIVFICNSSQEASRLVEILRLFADSSDSGVGIGVVARDSSSHVLSGLAQHSAGPTEAEFAEYAVLLNGLQLVLDHGWSSVLIERDSAKTVNRLSRPPSSDFYIFGPSLEPAHTIIISHPHIRLRYIPWGGQSVGLIHRYRDDS
ncbi:hypothetical protein GQ457_18G011670 [Hibiscus cannabinus]